MKQKYYKSIAILFLVWAGCSMPVHVSGQVSAWNRTRTTGKKYIQLSAGCRKKSCSQKDRNNLIVYSDRNGNQAYEDAYFQRKRGKQEIGVPYYIIDEETGTTVLSVPIKTL